MSEETTNQNSTEETRKSLEGFGDVKLHLTAILGSVKMPIGQFLKLSRGAIIELEQHKSSNIILQVNKHNVAEGEIAIKNDKIAVNVLSVTKPKRF
jgi:flagellar motor switch protein FliN/FliY